MGPIEIKFFMVFAVISLCFSLGALFAMVTSH